MTTEKTTQTTQTTQTNQHLPKVESMKFVQHTDLAESIIERLRQDETKKKALYAYLERLSQDETKKTALYAYLEQPSISRSAWEVWDKIREVFYEDIYNGIFLWPNECDEGQLEEIVNGCRDDKEKEFTKLFITEYNILIAELNKAESETVFIGVNW